MVHVWPQHLTRIATDIFCRIGLDGPDAKRVATSLVENNLMGHDSHGVLRISTYVQMTKDGRFDPQGEPTIVRESATTATMDGGKAFGQLVARQAMEVAMAKAREHDMGMVAIRNTGHTGRLGEYTVQAAEKGFIGLAYGSGPSAGGVVAPFLGTGRVFGTDPMSWAVPAATRPPVFLDFATATVAWGKIDAALDKGVSVPEGWILDAEGKPTTDPSQLREGGVLTTFGRHKGYCLAFFVELLTGALSQGTVGAFSEFEFDFPTIVSAINISAFQDLDEFKQVVDRLVETVKSSRKAPGVDEILVPGELEWRSREKLLREGIELPEATWQRIVDVAQELGVTIEGENDDAHGGN